jgi:HD-like signal output (HDOD) protein
MMNVNLLKWTQATINQEISDFLPPADLHQSISQIDKLPPFPATANRILQLASDPLADAKKLSEIIELDPLLAAQVIRWASSALYGFRGKISSVQDAIAKVLGFDFVFNLALSLAALAPLKSTTDGVIGSKSLWIQSLASSRLMMAIAEKIPAEKRPESQHIFLAGLMHNIGFILLGHQFSNEHAYLTELIRANPSLAINNIENFAFGYDHEQLGAWLMQTWDMPKPILDVVYHHHNPNYRGENHYLNLLVYLNDSMLGKIGIGDATHQLCPDSVFEQLGVKQTECEQQLNDLEQELEGIKATVATLLS